MHKLHHILLVTKTAVRGISVGSTSKYVVQAYTRISIAYDHYLKAGDLYEDSDVVSTGILAALLLYS